MSCVLNIFLSFEKEAVHKALYMRYYGIPYRHTVLVTQGIFGFSVVTTFFSFPGFLCTITYQNEVESATFKIS